MRALCRVGAIGNLEMVAFYAFRDHSGQIESGSYVNPSLLSYDQLPNLICSIEAYHDDDINDFGASVSGSEHIRNFLGGFEKWAINEIPDSEGPAHAS